MEPYTPHGYLVLSNLGGITISIDRTGESVRYEYYGKVAQRPCQIKYTPSGRAYFKARNRRWYLDEFIKQ